VSDLLGATLYAYRVDGPHDPAHALRFDPQKVLLTEPTMEKANYTVRARSVVVLRRVLNGHA